MLNEEKIRLYIEDYITEKKLNSENGGSNSKLSDAETKKLIIHLSEITYFHVKDIYAYVKREFDKKYTVSRMTKWLHANEFVYKKSHAVPGKAEVNNKRNF